MRRKSTELIGTIKAFVEEYYKNYRHSLSTTEIANAVGIARGTAYKSSRALIMAVLTTLRKGYCREITV